MATNEVKLLITSDATGAITGLNMAGNAMRKLESDSGGIVSKIKQNWMGLTATIGASLAAIHTGWDLAKKAAEFNEQMSLLNGLAGQYNTTATSIVDKIKEQGGGMISLGAAAEVAATALAKGLTPEMVQNTAKYAATLSDFMGMNAEDAFRKIADGLELGKEKTIKFAAGAFDLKEKFGAAVDKMTEAEKQTALYSIIADKAAEIQGRVGDQAKSTADKMDTMVTSLKDVQLYLGQGLLRVGAGALALLSTLAASALVLSASFWKTVEAGTRLLGIFTFGDAKKSMQEFAAYAKAAADTAYDMAGKQIGNVVAFTKAAFSSAEEAAKKTNNSLGGGKNQLALDKMAEAAQQWKEKMADAAQKWKEKIDLLNPALDESAKSVTELWDAAAKLKKEFGDQAWISEGLMKGLNFEVAKKDIADFREEIKKSAENTKEWISYLKDWRDGLVKSYDDAIKKAQDYLNIAQKAKDQAKGMKEYLAGIGAKALSPGEQMAKEKESFSAMQDTAMRTGDLGDLAKAFEQGRSFLEKYKDMKSVLGFTVEFSDVKDKMQMIADKTETIGEQAERQAAKLLDTANQTMSIIYDVDQQVSDLEVHLKSMEMTLDVSPAIQAAQLARAQIDTMFARPVMMNVQMNGANMPVSGYSNSGAQYVQDTYAIEQQIADNMANGRSPLNNSGLTVVE